MFCTNYCDSIQWIKKVIHKHWKPILKNKSLRSIFPNNPIIAQRTAPSRRNKLVRAKLRPLKEPNQGTWSPNPNQTPPLNHQTLSPNLTPCPNPTPPNQPCPPNKPSTSTTEPPLPNQTPSPNQPTNPSLSQVNPTHEANSYPYSLFKPSQQSFRNPIQPCKPNCNICKHLSTQTFVQSTLKKTKHPIHLPRETEHFNCQTSEVIYLITCNQTGCKTQYVGYTTRQIRHRFIEHLTDTHSPIYKHIQNTDHNKRSLTIHILTKPPLSTKDKDNWLRQQEYHWICKLATLNKTHDKGLNKTIFDNQNRSTV